MSDLAAIPAGSMNSNHLLGYKDMQLENLLIALCRFGEPRIFKLSRGWYCKVNMHISAKGTSYEVESEFDCKTPAEAAKQCAERVVETITHFNK